MISSSSRTAHLQRPFLAIQVVGQNYGLGKIAHRTPQSAAFVPQPEIGFLFGQVVLVLQDSLGALDQLSRFERALHVERFRHQPRVLNGDRRLPCDHLHEADFVVAEARVRRAYRC